MILKKLFDIKIMCNRHCILLHFSQTLNAKFQIKDVKYLLQTLSFKTFCVALKLTLINLLISKMKKVKRYNI